MPCSSRITSTSPSRPADLEVPSICGNGRRTTTPPRRRGDQQQNDRDDGDPPAGNGEGGQPAAPGGGLATSTAGTRCASWWLLSVPYHWQSTLRECQPGDRPGTDADLPVRLHRVRARLRAVPELLRRRADRVPGVPGRLRKMFNAVGVVFKGSGFYRNDSRATRSASPDEPSTESPSPRPSRTPGPRRPKSEKVGEPKPAPPPRRAAPTGPRHRLATGPVEGAPPRADRPTVVGMTRTVRSSGPPSTRRTPPVLSRRRPSRPAGRRGRGRRAARAGRRPDVRAGAHGRPRPAGRAPRCGSGTSSSVDYAAGTAPTGLAGDAVGRVLAAPVRAGEPVTDVRLVGAGSPRVSRLVAIPSGCPTPAWPRCSTSATGSTWSPPIRRAAAPRRRHRTWSSARAATDPATGPAGAPGRAGVHLGRPGGGGRSGGDGVPDLHLRPLGSSRQSPWPAGDGSTEEEP